MVFRMITLALAGQAALCQGPFERGTGSAENGADHPESAGSGAPMALPAPVLKPLEPPDNRFVALPGTRVARPPRVLKQAAPTHPLVMSPASPPPFAVSVLPLAPAVDLAQPASRVAMIAMYASWASTSAMAVGTKS